MPRPKRDPVAGNLASALLAGEWDADPMADRAAAAVGRRFRFIRSLIRGVLAAHPIPPDEETLTAHLAADPVFVRADNRHGLGVVRMFFAVPRMRPPRFPLVGELPSLATPAPLADWLGIPFARLAWYADDRNTNGSAAEPLRHYTWSWLPKPAGRWRLLEAPKPGLKRLQRRLLRDLLNAVPPHESAHGFRRGRSVLTNARPHCGRQVVLRFDLRDFFQSVSAARVKAVFRTLGYPPEVARLLTGLCTVRVPADVWHARPNPAGDGSDHLTWQRLADRHLPQGAPTSPALANLCAHRLDRRLAGLAAALGATYTRYADDLTFSGREELAGAANRMLRAVVTIATEEGFAVNARKTRSADRSRRQTVTGVVVNVRPNLPRPAFDRLKAVLTNCVRHGPASQNRDAHADFRAHLAGRVSHAAMLHPARGRKLWAIFDRIAWP